MKKIKITEAQKNKLIKIISEEANMFKVDQTNIVKKFLDSNFLRAKMKKIGENGLPANKDIVVLIDANKQPVKYISYKELLIILQNDFKNISIDKDERDDFLKDILIKWNKVYSPDTCCFVPVEINSLFTRTNSKRGKYPIGVCMNKSNGRFLATLKSKKFSKSYNTPEEAFQAYKEVKENYIKEVADEWKDKINPKVYEAMYNYQVEITD